MPHSSQKSLGDSIRHGAKWLVFGNIGQHISQFAFGVILARLLVPADFGMLVTIQVLTGLASMLTSGGMGQSLIRAKEVDENDFKAVFTMQLAIVLCWYALFFFSSPFLAVYFEEPLYKDLIRVSTLVFLIKPFLMMRNTWLTREMAFKERSLVGLITGFITGICSVYMAWLGMGVWSLTLAGLIGALSSCFMLALITPLKLNLSADFATMRKHSGYGIKITAIDILGYISRESKSLIISKMAGPALLGLFNKGESLSRMPNQIIMPASMQPLFRAMGMVQDDLDKTKYLYYRAITLVSVFTTPCYIGLWWVAEPFIETVYGSNWLEAVEPLRIMVIAGLFYNVLYPSGRLLDAQNKLVQEILVNLVRLVIVCAACYIGLHWGINGVAWGILASYIFTTISLYYLVSRTIHTKLNELLRALAPSLILNTILFIFLAIVHLLLKFSHYDSPLIYLLIMSFAGSSLYAILFLFLPIDALKTESSRWRQLLAERLLPRRRVNL